MRARLGIAVLGAAMAALLASATWMSASPSVAYVLLYPSGKTSHSGPIEIIVAGPSGGARPDVRLNGRPVRLERLRFAEDWVTPGAISQTASRLGDRHASDLWIGKAVVRAGRGALTVGKETVSLYGGKASPPGWQPYRRHPQVPARKEGSTCSGCHEMKAGDLGRASTPTSCSPCHSEVSVQTIHKHVAPPLARCAMCHDPHGSVRANLLTDAKEKLCTRCHAAGHSKG